MKGFWAAFPHLSQVLGSQLGGYGGDERVVGVGGFLFRIFRAPPSCPGVERQFSSPGDIDSLLR